MKPLAKNATAMPPSGIREVMVLASQIPDAIHLEVGEPGFPTPPHVVEGGCEGARQGFTKYAPSAGLTTLRQAIVTKLAQRNGIQTAVENVVVTAGAACAMNTSVFALADAGDEVLIPDPGWPNYIMQVLAAGAVPRGYPLRVGDGFLPDMQALRNMVTKRTKALIINTPSNPAGSVFPKEVMQELVQFAVERDLYVVSDEVYEELVFEGEHHSAASFDPDGRVLTVFGFSKTYAMTGWRLGYVVTTKELAQLLTKLQEPFVSCACSISQKAAEAALAGPQDCVAAMRDGYRRNRDVAVGILQAAGLLRYVPRGAFYVLVDISGTGMDSYTFAKELLREQKVAVAPGATFGQVAKEYVRVSLAGEEALVAEGVDRLCKYILERRQGQKA